MLGSFHEWNVEKAIEMENKDGIHTTKVALNPGTYEYSFLTDITNASTSFASPLNPEKDGEKSILHVPGIILERLPEAVEANSKSILEGEFFNENAKTTSLKGAKWTLKEKRSGVKIIDNALIVDENVHPDETITVQATYDGYISQKEITIQPTNEQAKSDEQVTQTIRIHYEREDQNYDGWNIWVWDDVAAPSEGWPDGAVSAAGIDEHGTYYDIQLAKDAEKIGFLFVNKRSGEQTGNYHFSMLEHKEIFVKDGDEQVYTDPNGKIETALLFGEIVSKDTIQLRFSSIKDLGLKKLLSDIVVQDENGNKINIINGKKVDQKVLEVNGEFAAINTSLTVTYGDKTLKLTDSWKLIDELYAYDGDLGATLHTNGTATLKVWAPKATNVTVVLYDKGNQYKVIRDEIPMQLGERGVWEVKLNKENTGLDNLKGYYYHYKMTHNGKTKLTLDPYAKSMAAWANPGNGGKYSIGKAAIVDPSEIGPALNFANIDGFTKREDAIIYEVHVRDFTSDPAIEGELNARFGTFSSFIDKLDYIKELGVTHIQLLPVMSYYFANEWDNDKRLLDWSSTGNNYNWGYDPHSYFSLSGMYSENPDDPELRIAEFKRLIHEIHKRDMGVVLDVVYNHTAKVEIFEDLLPNYYHFMDKDGTPRESFGGGRLGTTHAMSRKVLVDSVSYWVEEFKIDGFRFDMMGDHDAESIQVAYDRAKQLNPNIIMIGEGWRTYVGDEGEKVVPADQDWMQHTDSVAVFSDEFRNELKSGFGSEGQPRFLTGGARNIQQIFDNVTANPHNFVADDPGDVVSYIAAHDNLTLHDVIAQSIMKDSEYHEEEIHKRIRIGNAMVLTAQGKAFIHAGQEFGRTKQFRTETLEAPYKSTYMTDKEGKPFLYPYFIHDSYDSTDAINKIDWKMATDKEQYPIQHATREYTAGLIKLRRSTDAFSLGTMEKIKTNVKRIEAPEIQEEDLVIGYQASSSDGSEVYQVFVNADSKERKLTLKNTYLTKGKVIVDANTAGTEEIKHPTGVKIAANQIKLAPLTTVIVKMNHKNGDTEETDNTHTPGHNEPGQEKETDKEQTTEVDKDKNKERGLNQDKNKERGNQDENKEQELNQDKKQMGEGNKVTKKQGEELPNTATSFYNWLLAGFIFVLAGVGLYIYKRRK
ncbi:pullulanase [Virgibacillus pantothenticus]|uniref:pullulanase n=1 Tax=Virgibacillus pantothenticus TaxID=1473 RepID=UPI001B18658C|nr:pullulanase [Virgibacillus pantothenticus]GIP62624.1 pullulanase [Virgibacillus pantothenticus]